MEENPNNTYQVIALLKQYFFPSERNALSTHEIQIVLKICNSNFTYITVICKLIIRLDLNFDMYHLKVSTL